MMVSGAVFFSNASFLAGSLLIKKAAILIQNRGEIFS